MILKRIGVFADKRLSQAQNGFLPKKSCRDAVFKLWRKLGGLGEGGEVI